MAAEETVVVSFRVSPEELAAIDAVSRRVHAPRSQLLRAGLRAVVERPVLVWEVANADALPVPAERPRKPPPPPRRRRKR